MTQLLHDLKLNPSDTRKGYTVSTSGLIVPFGGALPVPATGDAQAVKEAGNGAYAWTSGNVPLFPRTMIGPVRAIEIVDWADPSGYTMTWDGEVWPWGPNADMPVGQVTDEIGYVADTGWHDFVMNPAGDGQGYVLYYTGSMVAIGGAPNIATEAISNPGQNPGSNYARRLEMQWSSKKYVVMSSWGEFHAVEGASVIASIDYPMAGDSGTGHADAQTFFPNIEMLYDFKIYDWSNSRGWCIDRWGIVRALNGAQSFPYLNAIKSQEMKWMAIAIVQNAGPATIMALSNIGERPTLAASDIPTLTVLGPTGTISTTTRPSVSWAYSSPTEGQASAEIKIFSAAQYGAGGFDPDTSTATWSTIFLSSSVSTVQPNIDFPNGAWRAYVRVTSSAGLVSSWGYSGWTQSITPPNTPTLVSSSTGLIADGATLTASILSPGAAVVGMQYMDAAPYPQVWRWVRDGDALVPTGGGATKTAVVVDKDLRLGVQRSYRAVAYIGTTNVIGSAFSNVETETLTELAWVLSGFDSGTQLVVAVVPPFEYKRPQIAGAFYPVATEDDPAPAAIVVSDGRPRSAEFTATFRTLNRDDFDDLVAVLLEDSVMLLRDPFGNAWPVKIAPGAVTFQLLRAAKLKTEAYPIRHAHEIPVPFVEIKRPVTGPTEGTLALLD